LNLEKNSKLILTSNQKIWIRELIEGGCEVIMDDDLLERTSISTRKHINKVNQKKFNILIQMLHDRDSELGACFERDITFETFEDDKLTWSSMADGEDKKMLITHWGLINMFVKDIFGFETKIVNISVSEN
jgi:hypothetical protein